MNYFAEVNKDSKIPDILLKDFCQNPDDPKYKQIYWQESPPVVEINKKINECTEKFGYNVSKELQEDIWFSSMLYGCSFEEYFLFHFDKLKSSERNKFLCDKERFVILRSLYDFDKFEIIRNKKESYQYYKEYYNRDIIEINNETKFEIFYNFCASHNEFVFKPLRAYCGLGVEKYSVDINNDKLIREVFYQLKEKCGIIDELVYQSEETSIFNPSSVNTFRVVTYLTKLGSVIFKHGYFRTGRKGKIVDNGGSGGIFSAIDEEEGVICSNGADEGGNIYEIHPDSGVRFKGFKIPRWNEAKKIAEEVAKKSEFAKCIGMDLALTKNGWKLIETNPFPQFLAQIATDSGIKSELIDIVKMC